MKRPSFQFYPADWQANSNLRRCSHEEKGIWLDVLCLLHDQEQYGVCTWPLKEIAQAIGTTEGKLRGLVAKGVLKGADAGKKCEPLIYVPRSGRKNGTPVTLIEDVTGPIWYSSRMVVDEHKRVLRGEAGAASITQDGAPMGSPKGGFGAAPKGTPDPSPFSYTRASRAGASSPSSSSSTTNTNTPIPPEGGDGQPVKKSRKSEAICLQTFLEACKQKGERPLRDYEPLWRYTRDAGLDSDMVALAWAEFRRRFGAGGTCEQKRYKDWRKTFRNYVENNYFKLWAVGNDGAYFLTSAGKQCLKVHDAREAA